MNFSRHPDPERADTHYYRAPISDGRTVIVQEVSIGVWGWLVVNDADGAPLEMRNGFENVRETIVHVGNHLGFDMAFFNWPGGLDK